MAVPGSFVTVLEPRTYIAPRFTKLPAMSLPLDSAWPTGWIKVQNTANGVQITFVNPHQDVTSDENGVIASLPSGADTINMTWQSRTPEDFLLRSIGGLVKVPTAARPQKETLTITGSATAGGNVSVTLQGITATIAVLTGDTPTVIAGKIRAGTFPNHVVSGTGADVVFTQITPALVTSAAAFNPGATGATGGFASPATQLYTKAFDELYLDPKASNEFMVGIEGEFAAGTLREEAGIIRVFGYNCQQTDNPQFALRSTGSDGLLQPVATVRCLPGEVTAAMLQDTGITQVDPKNRFSWFYR